MKLLVDQSTMKSDQNQLSKAPGRLLMVKKAAQCHKSNLIPPPPFCPAHTLLKYRNLVALGELCTRRLRVAIIQEEIFIFNEAVNGDSEAREHRNPADQETSADIIMRSLGALYTVFIQPKKWS